MFMLVFPNAIVSRQALTVRDSQEEQSDADEL